jgi:hypothetical protein
MKKAPLSEPTEPPSTNGMKTMTATVQDEYGTAPEQVLRLAEIARPAIADDEFLVRVRAASVDRGTWHLMAGLAYPMRLAAFGLRAPKAATQAGAWPGRSSPLARTSRSSSRAMTSTAPATAPSLRTPGLRRDGSRPSRRTCPSSRRRPSLCPR